MRSLSVSVPAQARDRYDRDRDGISAGEIIAGAVVLGGIAAVLSSGNNRREDRYSYDDRYDYNRAGYNYENRGGSSRAAVNQCVTSVERWANGYSRSDVTQVRSIERTGSGYRVKGNVVVQDGSRGRNYDSGYGADRYNQDDRYDRYDRNDRHDRYYNAQNYRRDDWRGGMLYLGHRNGVKDDFTPLENLHASAAIAGERIADTVLLEALVDIGLAARLDVPARSLSQGQRRRVALARLLADTRSALWILDEPFTALDVRAVAVLAAAMAAHLRRGGALIYTTHQPVDIEAERRQTLNLDDYAC